MVTLKLHGSGLSIENYSSSQVIKYPSRACGLLIEHFLYWLVDTLGGNGSTGMHASTSRSAFTLLLLRSVCGKWSGGHRTSVLSWSIQRHGIALPILDVHFSLDQQQVKLDTATNATAFLTEEYSNE